MAADTPMRRVKDFSDLKELVRERRFVSEKDVLGAYPGIEDDIETRGVSGGELIVIRERNRRNRYLFPRNTTARTRLTGTVVVAKGSKAVTTTHDLRVEIGSGDAVVVKGKTYRIAGDVGATGFALDRPLDAKRDAKDAVALRQGASNDIRTKWRDLAEGDCLEYSVRNTLSIDTALLREGAMTEKQIAELNKGRERSDAIVKENKRRWRKAAAEAEAEKKKGRKRKRGASSANAHMPAVV